MIRRLRGPACLATAILTLATLTACTQPDEGTTVKGENEDVPIFFAASTAGAFLVSSHQAFTVSEPGAKAQAAACCSPGQLPQGSHYLRNGAVALDGTPWVILDDGSASDLQGKEHAAGAAVRRLTQGIDILKVPAANGKPATTRKASLSVETHAVSVVDSTTVLAATYTFTNSHLWRPNDSVVYRITASGAPVAVAGRPGLGNERPVSGLKIGEHVAATGVDLERVLALVALDQHSFVLFLMTPTPSEDYSTTRVQAALVTNGQISQLKLPALCARQYNVVASRISDHEVVLNALKATGDCSRATNNAWLKLDTTRNTFTEVGSGAGFTGITGDQLLTATIKMDEGAYTSLTTVRWQDLPDRP